VEEVNTREYFYGPVFILGKLRFVWFAENLLDGTPEGAKKIGQELAKGYAENNLPLEPAETVARFKSDGNYVMAHLGPEGDARPVIALNPGEAQTQEFEGGAAQQEEAQTKMDPVEEIPYDKVGDTTFMAKVNW
jgi:hypothetical protein